MQANQWEWQKAINRMLYSASAGIPFLGKATDDMLLTTDVLNPYLLILNLEVALSVMACLRVVVGKLL